MKSVWILAILLIMSANTYADESSTVQQGAQKYDWQTCVTSKANDCVNNTCATSDDPNCSDNCNTMAKDKCQTEGLNPP